MTKEELRQICIDRNIEFIPHHPCSICGVEVGWKLFYRKPYEVLFDSNCGCGYGPTPLFEEDWEDILEWVTDKDGNVIEEYKYLLE